MRIEFTATRDRGYARHVIHRSIAQQRWFSHVLGILLIAFGLPGSRIAGPVGAANLGVVLFGALIALLPLTSAWQLVTQMPDHCFGPHRYLLTDDSYRVSTPTSRFECGWVEFTGLTETRRALILWRGRQALLDVPTQALTAQQLRELRAFLASNAFAGFRRLPGTERPRADRGQWPGDFPA